MASSEKHIDFLLMLYGAYLEEKQQNEGRVRRRRRRWSVRPIFQMRNGQGAWDNLVQEMMVGDPAMFSNFHRLNCSTQFNFLLSQIEHKLNRDYLGKETIPSGLKLSLTLRYLASGDSMTSLSYLYRIGKSTVSAIIPETCRAIYEFLQPRYLKAPGQDDWQRIANEFYDLWDFPNCVGAIDGKHVVVQVDLCVLLCFFSSENYNILVGRYDTRDHNVLCMLQNFHQGASQFFNYKGSYSIVLLAVCDAQYRFTLVSIGSAGRESDARIFEESGFGKAILNSALPLPPAGFFDGFSHPLPSVFLGDPAFPLCPTLMRPFSGNQLAPDEIIFNYRHSRARRTIENAFGILASRFRIFRRPITAKVETVDSIVMAAVALHNWLRTDSILSGDSSLASQGLVDCEDERGSLHPGSWRNEASEALLPIAPTTSRNSSRVAKATRSAFKSYFMTSGQVPWQWNKLPAFQADAHHQT